MYYVNISNQNTCAPRPNVLATTESQPEHQFLLCQPTTRLTFHQKNLFLAFDFTESWTDYFMFCLTAFCFRSQNNKIIEPGLASRIYLVGFPYWQLINIYCVQNNMRRFTGHVSNKLLTGHFSVKTFLKQETD